METLTIEIQAPSEVIKAARALIMGKPDNAVGRGLSRVDWTLRETAGHAQTAWQAYAFSGPELALASLLASIMEGASAAKQIQDN